MNGKHIAEKRVRVKTIRQVSWKEREEDNLDCMKCNDKATSRRRTGQLGYGCSSFQGGMMMVRVHGRQLTLAAESEGSKTQH